MIPATVRQKRETTHEEMISKSLHNVILSSPIHVTTAYYITLQTSFYHGRRSKEEKQELITRHSISVSGNSLAIASI